MPRSTRSFLSGLDGPAAVGTPETSWAENLRDEPTCADGHGPLGVADRVRLVLVNCGEEITIDAERTAISLHVTADFMKATM